MKFLVYDNATGHILRTGCCPDDHLGMQASAGETAIEGEADDAMHYIRDGLVTDKMAIAATLSGTTISGLPIPATVTVEGVRYDVTDGVAELSFNLPGTYQVKVEALHYLPKTFEITV